MSVHIKLVRFEQEQKVAFAHNPKGKCRLPVDYVIVFRSVTEGEVGDFDFECKHAFCCCELHHGDCDLISVMKCAFDNDALCLFMSRDLYLTNMTHKHLCISSDNR